MISVKQCGREDFPKSAMVACQGVKGAFSQVASDILFEDPQIMFMRTFDGVFRAVDSGLCTYGILPIENSNAGSVTDVYDLMREYHFYVVRSIKISIPHILLGNEAVGLDEISEIFTHEQAARQCSKFIERHPSIKLSMCENTAVAAQMVAESARTDIAAIASEKCIDLYNLVALERNIENNASNYTRFICISKECEIYGEPDRISLMLSTKHKAGALNEVMQKFADRGLNLVKLESRPIPGSDFEFMFYFDVEANINDREVHDLLMELEKESKYFAFLGNYNEVICTSESVPYMA